MPKSDDAAPAAPKIPKGGALLANLPMDQILVKKGFNPRTDLGDLTQLKRNLSEHGVLSAIVVCPHATKADTYYVVAGERRFTSWSELGKANIPVQIRADLRIDSDEALALAVSENSPDGRTNLSPLDEAAAFKRLFDSLGGPGSEVKIGEAVGYSAIHVKRTLKLLTIPDSVKKRLAKGEISKATAIAVSDVPDEVRDRVVARVTSGTTETEVGRMVNEARKEARASAPTDTAAAPASRHNRPAGQEAGAWVQPRLIREVRKMIESLGADCLNAQMDIEESKDPAAVASLEASFNCKSYALSALLWQTGGMDKIDPGCKDFKRILVDIKQRFEDRDAAGKTANPVKAKAPDAPKAKKVAKTPVADEPDDTPRKTATSSAESE